MSEKESSRIVKCVNCSANNRVSVGNQDKQPVCGRCKSPLSDISVQPITVTDANYSELVEKSSVPVLLDLWAAWCGPCHMLAPVIDKVAQETAGKALVGKLNVDENRQTAARFHVQGIPTMIILQNGREVDRLVGVQTKETILSRLQPFM